MFLNHSEIILNCNNVSFDSFVCQTSVQTEKDKAKLRGKDYPFIFTEAEFQGFMAGVDPKNIYYIPSISASSIYFNKETLAVCPCHIELMWMAFQNGENKVPGMLRAIASVEEDVANMKFSSSLMVVPDGARCEYFNMLLKKFPDGGKSIPDLFQLFLSFYTKSDFGSQKLDQDVLQKIMQSQHPKDIMATKSALKKFPDMLTVYRGGSNDVSTPAESAHSWTLDISIANFFAARLGTGRGYIVKGTIPKDKVLFCCFSRGEQEVFVSPNDVSIQETIELKGLEDCEKFLPKITPMYFEYMDVLDDLEFSMDSEVHGRVHEARVLLLALTIAHYLGLSQEDQEVLGMASVYHDTCRDNDAEDGRHGYEAMLYYEANAEYVDPLVGFLIEYHCRPDADGYKNIETNPVLRSEKARAKLLFDVFKDADALDRVRFGLRDLDVNQLRIPVSKTLSVVANIYLSQIKA